MDGYESIWVRGFLHALVLKAHQLSPHVDQFFCEFRDVLDPLHQLPNYLQKIEEGHSCEGVHRGLKAKQFLQ